MAVIIAHFLYNISKVSLKKNVICSPECLALYGKYEIMPQAHGKAEGQELSRLSTSEHSQVHWDDELMQSLSSLSSASDPLHSLPHTLLAFLISSPPSPILLTHSYLFLLPLVCLFFLHKPFSLTLLSSSSCISPVSPITHFVL